MILFQLGKSVIKELHGCHPGVFKMKALARSYWGPSLDEMIKACVKQCKICQVHQSMPASAPIHHWE